MLPIMNTSEFQATVFFSKECVLILLQFDHITS
jgi:hypothetical protein